MAGLTPFNNRNLVSEGASELFNMIDNFFPDSLLKNRNTFLNAFRVDVKETVDAYIVEAELPGVKKEEIDLSVNEGRLTISVKREESVEDKQDDSYIHKERRYGSMQRTLYLEGATDTGSAQLDDGLLKVTVPKETQANNANRIEID
ncbi:MAG TPA: Hsp20/alpha crystallin family protein [Pseudogracilibacillus sp.]|nr:Hsp20/alpha crystallin family protein [Pseudogracilibacillus sp.]